MHTHTHAHKHTFTHRIARQTDNKKSQNFTTEGVTSLKEIQIEMDQLIIGFGHLSINRESLMLSENQLKQNLAQLKIKEKKRLIGG